MSNSAVPGVSPERPRLPLLPIGLFLRMGLPGIGWDTYEEPFRDQRLLRLDCAYPGLPDLDADQYIHGEHLLGASNTLMPVPLAMGRDVLNRYWVMLDGPRLALETG